MADKLTLTEATAMGPEDVKTFKALVYLLESYIDSWKGDD
jgi:hypothetical protein